jgi:hypothetical protein
MSSFFKLLALLLLGFPVSVRAVDFQGGDLPEGPRSQLNKALNAWNENYGTHVRAVQWNVRGKIGTGSLSLGSVREDISNPARAWVPDGDIDHPKDMRAVRLDQVEGIEPESIKSWRLSADKAVQEDAWYYIDISWEQDGQKFHTTAVASQDRLLYESMIFNARLARKHNSCFYTSILWLWGDVSGEITADIKSLCEKQTVTSCDEACEAWMTLGSAEVKCDAKKVSATTCQMKYAWAWATPLVSLRFQAEKFDFTTSGIGSRGKGNASCSLKCP